MSYFAMRQKAFNECQSKTEAKSINQLNDKKK